MGERQHDGRWAKFEDFFFAVLGAVSVVGLLASVIVGSTAAAASFLVGLLATVIGIASSRGAKADVSSAKELKDAAEQLRPEDLSTHLKFNQTELEEYSRQTRRQARQSFWASILTMGAGLAILVVGALVAIDRADQTQKITVSVLAAIGTLLSGYISRTFLWVHERALAQLNFYFQQPVVTSYFLRAERLAEKLPPAERSLRMQEIIEKVLETAVGISDQAAELLAASPRRREFRRGRRTEGAEHADGDDET